MTAICAGAYRAAEGKKPPSPKAIRSPFGAHAGARALCVGSLNRTRGCEPSASAMYSQVRTRPDADVVDANRRPSGEYEGKNPVLASWNPGSRLKVLTNGGNVSSTSRW